MEGRLVVVGRVGVRLKVGVRLGVGGRVGLRLRVGWGLGGRLRVGLRLKVGWGVGGRLRIGLRLKVGWGLRGRLRGGVGLRHGLGGWVGLRLRVGRWRCGRHLTFQSDQALRPRGDRRDTTRHGKGGHYRNAHPSMQRRPLIRSLRLKFMKDLPARSRASRLAAADPGEDETYGTSMANRTT